MYHWLMRTGRFWAIMVLISLAFAYGIQWFQPYHVAENQMTRVILNNQGIEARLEIYGQTALKWREQIRPAVDASRAAILIFDLIKKSIGWENFLNLAGEVSGRRYFLNTIDNVARDLVKLDETLERVSIATKSSSGFSRMIDQNFYLEKEDLQQIYNDNSGLILGLIETEIALGNISNYIKEIFEISGWSDLLTSLDGWSNNDVLGTKDLFSATSRCIQAWEELPAILDQLRSSIRSDAIALGKVIFWFGFAKTSETIIDFLPIRSLSTWIIERQPLFLTAFVACVAVSIGGWVGAFAVRQAWWHGVTKSRRVVVDQKPQPVFHPASPSRQSQKPTKHIVQVKIENRGQPAISTLGKQGYHQAVLVCHWLDGRTHTLNLPDVGRVTIGSDPADDVQTKPGTSSKTQAIIKFGKVSYFLEVLDTNFPTKLNEQIISGARKINSSDTIRIGDLTAVVVYSK